MQIGDLVTIVSASDEKGYCWGVGLYLGTETTWKQWHKIYVRGKPCFFDEPYWEVKAISAVNTKL